MSVTRSLTTVLLTDALYRQFLNEYDELVEKLMGPGVKLGSWHLQLIGVKRSCHNKGAGTALLKFHEEKVCPV